MSVAPWQLIPNSRTASICSRVISDAALDALYDGCAFAFYPSLAEGWELPVTEAMIHGKVPVVGNNSSLPEAGGEFAIYIDASSPADMAMVIGDLIRHPLERAPREQLNREQFRPRGWAAVAMDMIAIAIDGSTDAASRSNRF